MTRAKAWQMYPMLNPDEFSDEQVGGHAVKCGNRTDLFKKMRRHVWYSMGLDWGHGADGYFVPCLMSMCMRCGVGHASAL
jgi:hypothetical protein